MLKHGLVVLLFSLTMAACGSSDDDASGTGSSVLELSKLTLPVMTSSSTTGFMRSKNFARLDAAPSWMTWGNMADESAYILLDPTSYEADGYSMGTNNLYHLLKDLGSFPETFKSDFNGISGVPFFKDVNDATGFFPTAFSNAYTMSGNGGNTYYGKTGDDQLITYATAGGSSDAASSYQGQYNSATKALQVRMAGHWPATLNGGAGYFVMRSEFFGNPDTHEFTIRLTKNNVNTSNVNTGAYYIQIVGKGVSRGSGAYFLFHIKDNNNANGGNGSTTLGTTKKFCYSAETMVATEVTSNVGSSNCASYDSAVGQITPLDAAALPSNNFSMTVTTN